MKDFVVRLEIVFRPKTYPKRRYVKIFNSAFYCYLNNLFIFCSFSNDSLSNICDDNLQINTFVRAQPTYFRPYIEIHVDRINAISSQHIF